MDEKKNNLSKKVEDTMACSAFAEAGEPCPLDKDQKEKWISLSFRQKDSLYYFFQIEDVKKPFPIQEGLF